MPDTPSAGFVLYTALCAAHHAERLQDIQRTVLAYGGPAKAAEPCDCLPESIRGAVLGIQAAYPTVFPVYTSLYAATIAMANHATELRTRALVAFPDAPTTTNIIAPTSTLEVLMEVLGERARQDAKWGEQNLPSVHVSPTTQKVADTRYYGLPHADLARELCDRAHKKQQVTWAHIMVEEASEVVDAPDDTARRGELVQLAAVCVAEIECIDRNSVKEAQNA